MVCERPDTIKSVTKLLYPEVAKRFRTNDKQVERAIRNTIETAWEKGNSGFMRDMFGICSTMSGCVRPTNTEFIEIIARKIVKNMG